MDDLSILSIELFLSIFVYLLFPISYSATKGKVNKSKAKGMAFINSLICGIIFTIIRIALGAEQVVNFGPAVFYFFIAKKILTEKTEKEPENNDENSI